MAKRGDRQAFMHPSSAYAPPAAQPTGRSLVSRDEHLTQKTNTCQIMKSPANPLRAAPT